MLTNASEVRERDAVESLRPLTLADINDIRVRGLGNHDVKRLLGEVERLTDSLNECWATMSQVARDQTANPKQMIEAVLTRQQAPGWKQ